MYCPESECWQTSPCLLHGLPDSAVDDSERRLACIVMIQQIEPIAGADRIELASVLGWKVAIAKADGFTVGSLAIYFAIDSILDATPATAFLQGKPLKTKKIRGVISQGLLAPLSWLSHYTPNPEAFKEDDDVTRLMRVRKHVAPEEQEAQGGHRVKIPFPYQIPRTCESRGQEAVKLIRSMPGKSVVITIKFDGCSATFYLCKGDFGIAGRNEVLFQRHAEADAKLELPEPVTGATHYFKANERYDLESKMRRLGRDLAIQGEVVGPKVNCNRLQLADLDFFVFNIWDISSSRYLNWDEVESVAVELGLKCVTTVFRGEFPEKWASIEALLELAGKQVYGPKIPAEGIVVKTDHEDTRRSFKVISNSYLTKHDI